MIHILGSLGRGNSTNSSQWQRCSFLSTPLLLSFSVRSTSTCITHPTLALRSLASSPWTIFSSTPPSNPLPHHTSHMDVYHLWLKLPTLTHFLLSFQYVPPPPPQQFLSLLEIHNPLFSPLSSIHILSLAPSSCSIWWLAVCRSKQLPPVLTPATLQQVLRFRTTSSWNAVWVYQEAGF